MPRSCRRSCLDALAVALTAFAFAVPAAPVSAAAPTVDAVKFLSSPQSGDTYGVGERITVEVEWSEGVTVTGSPRLALTVGSNTRYAEYAGGANPRFRYTVGTADRDTNGLSVAAGALELNGGAIRSESTSENADIGLGSHAITDDSSHKVDGSIAVAAIVTAVRVATRPSGGRAYFRTGERIRVEVRFGKPVSANLPPRLALSIGDTTRQVNAFASSGHSEFLTFDYTVQADDYDPDGFSIAAGALTLPAGGRVVDRGARAANLNLGRHAISGAAGYRVNNAPPSFGSTTVANRTFALDAPIAPLVLPEATGEGTLRYTLTPSTLPPGMTWTPATRTISGTPTAVTAARTYTWKATDSEDETATLTFIIAVAEIPTITLTVDDNSVDEGDGATTITVTATVDGTTRFVEDKTIEVSVAGSGTATAVDFAAVTDFDVEIAAGAASQTGTFTLTPTDDALDEADETVTVSGSSSGLTVNPATISLTDNDATPTLSIDSPSVTEGDSGAVNLTFTVTLSAASGRQVTVNYADAGTGTTTSGTDYTAITGGTLTFAAGTTSRTFNVSVTGDTLDELDETVVVTLSSATNAAISTATGTGTIIDDDSAPTLSIDSPSVTEGDSGAVNLTFTVTLSAASGRQVTVAWADAGIGTATSGTDYTALTAGTLAFAAGTTSRTFNVSVTGDTTDESNETVVVTLRNPTNAMISTGTGTGTITDNDAAPTLSIDSPSVTEGDSGAKNLTFTVRLSASSGKQVTVDWADAGTGTATGTGTDYTAITGGTLTFAAGTNSRTFNVSVTGDTTAESNETVVVTLSGATNATISTATGTGTITDDDSSPSLSIDSPSVMEGNSGSKNLTFTVTLSAASGRQVTVNYADAGTGTATSGTDYTAITGGTLTFAAGTTSRTFNVSVTGDTTAESNETVVVTLSDATNAAISTATGTGTITGDDTAGVTYDPTTLTVTEEGPSQSFTVVLNSQPPGTVWIGFTPESGIVVDEDFSPPRNISFGPMSWNTPKTVNVRALADSNLQDETRRIKVVVTQYPGANVPTSANRTAVTVTVIDDDKPTVSLSLSRASIPENGGAATVTATLDEASTTATTITVSAGAGTAADSSDFTLSAANTLTIAAGSTTSTGTVTITAVNDTLDEPDKRVTVSGSVSHNGVMRPSNRTLTITDDDPAPTLSIDSPSVTEGDSGATNLTFTATLSAASGRRVTVDWAGAGGTATSGTDYVAITGGTLAFAAGTTSRTFNVSVTGDVLDESNETVAVSLSNPTNATVSSTAGTGAGTITDDDAEPSLSIDSPSVTEGDVGSRDLTFTVRLSAASGRQVTVDWAEGTGGTATSGTDYTAITGGTLTFAAGTISRTFNVSVTGDTLDESNETVVVSLSNATNATVSSTAGTGTGTITDDDTAGVVKIPSFGSVAGPALHYQVHRSNISFSLPAAAGGDGAVTYALAATPTLPGGLEYAPPAAGAAHGGIISGLPWRVAPRRTYTLTATDAVGNAAELAFTVVVNAAPGVTLAVANGSIPENGGSTMVTATLSHASNAATTITVIPVAGAYTVGADATIVIPAGDTANAADTASITAVNDTIDNVGDREVTVRGSASNAHGVMAVTGAALTLTDNEATPTVTLFVNPEIVAEGGSAAVTATLNHASSEAVRLTVSAAASVNTAAGDFTLSSARTLTIAAGSRNSTGAVTIETRRVTTDSLIRGVDIEATVSGASGVANPAGITLPVLDNDGAPTVTLSLSDSSISEAGGTSTVTATLNRASSVATTITITSVPGFYTAGSDFYRATPESTIVIAAGETTNAADTATVVAVDNDTDSPNRTVQVTGQALYDASLDTLLTINNLIARRWIARVRVPLNQATGNARYSLDVNGATLILEDDDAPPWLTLRPADESISENNGRTAIRATLNRPSSAATTVSMAVFGGSTTAPAGDYTLPADTTLTIAAGKTASADAVTVVATDNAVDQPDRRLVLAPVSPQNSQGIGQSVGTQVAITDDDDAPTVRLALADSSISENGGTTTVTATLSHPSSAATTITVASVPGFYTVGSDATITIPAGSRSNAADTVSITAVDDTIDDPDNRRTTVTGSASNTQGVGSVTGAALTLIDDDGPPTVTLALADSPISENGGTTTVSATLTFSWTSEIVVTVSGLAGAYAVGADTTIAIPAGQTQNSSDTVTVTAVDNATDEPDRSVTVAATAEYLAPGSLTRSVGVSGAVLTLEDDDAAPYVTLQTSHLRISENGGTANLSAQSSHPSSAVTKVTISVAPSSRAPAGDYVLSRNRVLTIAAGATTSTGTVTVTAVDNDRDEPFRWVVLRGTPQNSQGTSQFSGLSLAIDDDDDAPTVTLALTDASIAENGGATTVTATLSHVSSEDTTITVTALDGAYTVGTDATIVIAAGATSNASDTAAITAVDDDVDNVGNRTVTVTATAVNSHDIGTVTGASLTLTDDEETPAVTLALSEPDTSKPDTIAESGSGNASMVTATLSRPSSEAVTLTVAAAPGANTVEGDFTLSSAKTLTIAAGSTASAGTVTVTAVDDTKDAPDKSVTVSAAVSGASGVAAPADATLTITDDDDPPAVSISSPSVSEGAAGTTATLRFEVTLGTASGRQVTVDYAESATGRTATPGTDYTALASGTLTIAAGDTSGVVAVTVVGDGTDEPDEQVKVVLSGPVNATLGTATGTGTITDDDAAPAVTLAVADGAVGEDGGTTTVTATLSHASSEDTTITVTALDGAYTVGTDATIVIVAGATSNASDTAAITAVDDDVDNVGNRTVTVTATAVNSHDIGTVTGASLTLTDDEETPAVTLALSEPDTSKPDTIAESGSGNASTVTATLSGTSSEAVTLTVAAAPGANAVAGDFTLSPAKTLTIAAGSTASTGAVTVTAVDDTKDAPDKEVTVTATVSGTSGVAAPSSVTLTITDDDDAPGLSISSPRVDEGDSGTVGLEFTVSLSAASGRQVTVGYADAGTGTATSGTDYTAISAGTLTFAAGETAKTLTVLVTGDETDEPDETVVVSLSGSVNAAISTASGTGTITDDDATPTVTLALSEPDASKPDTVNESGAGNSSTVTATLSGRSSAEVILTVAATAGANAVAGDFALSSAKTLTIAAGSTASTGAVTVTAVDDTKDAPDKSVTVTAVVSGSSGVAAPSSVTLTITDDDGEPSLSIDSPRVSEGDSGSASLAFTVSLSAASGRQVTVGYADAGTGTASSGTDYTALASGTLTFAAGETGKTVTVSVTGDGTDEPDETVVVTLSGAVNAVIGTASGTGTITDDDATPTVTLALSEPDASKPDTVNESGAGNSSTVTATLSGRSSAEVILTVAATAGANAVAGDFALSSAKTLTIAAGATASTGAVTVTAVDDTKDAPDKEVTVTATVSGTSGVAAPAPRTLTITDDDDAPAVTLAVVDSSILENGGSTTVTAALSHPSSADTAITVTVAAGTGAVATDFTQTGATLTVAAGATRSTGTVTVTANDDTTDAPDKEVTISGSAVNAQGVGAVTGTTLTITDDDAAPGVTLALADDSIAENGGSTTVTATLSHPSSAATTVTVTGVSGLYTAGADATIVIAAGATANAADTATIEAVNDAIDNVPDRAGTVAGMAANAQATAESETMAVTGAPLTLEDDEDTPTATLVLTPATIDESAPGNVSTVTATLNGRSSADVVLTVSATASTHAQAGDFTLSGTKTLTIAAGATSSTGTVTVTATADTTDAPDKTVTISATVSGDSGVAAPDSETLTIEDDEAAPTVTLALADTSIAENGGSTTVTATLSHPSSAATTVTVTGVSGLYTAGADATIVIAAGATANAADTATIEAVNDAIDNVPDRAGTVAGMAANAQATAESETMAVTGATLTITDDDTAGFAVSPSTSTTSRLRTTEDGGTATFEVELGSEPTGDVVLGVASSDTTEGTVSASSLTFTATTWNTAQTVTLTGVDDAPANPVDGDRSYTVTLTVNRESTADPTYDALSAVTVYAVNADNEYGLDVGSVTGQATEAGGTATFTVALVTRPSAAVTVSVTSRDTSEGAASPSSLTFAATAWNVTQAVTVTGADDAIDDGEVTWNVRLDPSSGDANYDGLANVDVLVTTTDDDDAPGVVLAVSPSSIAENGGVSTVSATLTHPSSAATTVTVTPVSGFYTVGSDATIVIAAGETANATDTATVAAVDNDTDALDRAGTVTVTVSNDRATADGTTLAVSGGALTVTDDDAAPNAALSLNPASVSENGGASAVSATLTHPSSEPTTVTVTPVSGAYTVGSDATIVIAAGETANATDTAAIAGVDNATDEPDRTATVTATLTNSQGAGTVTGATLTLEDDDAAPGVTLALSPSSISENGGGSTVTATLSRASSAATTVTVTPVSGFYTVGSDAEIVIAAGETANAADKVTIAAVDNATDAPDRAGTVTVTVSNDVGTGSVTGGALTVTDDDAAPNATLSLNPSSVSENGGTSAVSATLTHPSSEPTTVTVTPVSGAYTVGSDATIVIAAGETANATDTAAIAGMDNAKDEPDRTATVTATLTNSQGAGTVTGATLTLEDDDAAPGVTLALSPSSISENGGGSTVTATLSRASSAATTVTVTPVSGFYTVGSDAEIVIAAGETANAADKVTIAAVDNATDAPDRAGTVTVTVSNDVGTGSVTGGALTVTDDDAAPNAKLSLNPSSVSENGGSSAVSATLTHPSSEPTTVTVTPVSGAYTVGSDATIVIAAGETANATDTAAIAGVDNATDEPDRTATVTATLTNSQGAGTVTGATLTLEDDDAAPGLSISSPSVDEGAVGTTATLRFEVSLSAASGRQVTVGYADAGTGTATSGTDYTAISAGTLTFAAGETAKTVTVSVTGDTTDEPDETVVVSLSGSVNAAISTASGTGTITDDDATPTVTLALSEPDASKPDTVNESGAGNSSTVTATLSGRSSAEVILTVAATAGANAVAGDFALSSAKTLTIAAGSTASTGAVTVTAVDDTKDAPDKSVTVSATVSGSSGVAAPSAVTLTITDDDGEPSLSIDSPSVAEGDSGSASLEFTVSLSTASGRQVTVGYADAGTGTATSGTDYTAISAGTLTFAAGETAKTVTVSVTGDTTDEPDETVVVSLSGSVNAAISTASGTGTITDDDATPTVTLALSEPDASKPDTVNESGAGNSSTVTATLSGPSSADVILTVAATAGANAVAGDFALSSAKTLTIAAGTTTSSGVVTVTANDDTTDSPDKEVTVTATVSGTSGVAAPSSVTLTITDDDGEPSLSIDSPSVDEGDSGSVSLEFTVSLGAASGRQVTVGYADAGTGTATSGTDYTAISAGTLTFAAGETAKTVTVSVTGDETDEPDETVVVTLSGPTNAVLGTASGTGTITDDDGEPSLSIDSPSVTEGNSGPVSLEFTVSLSAASGQQVTVGYADAGTGTASSGTDYTALASGTLTFAAGETGKTLTVSVTGDGTSEPDETVVVTLSGPANAVLGTASGTGTITDDDGAPSLSIDSPSVTEGDSGPVSLEFTVSLSAASGQQVTVGYADAGTGTATAGTDYTALGSGTLTFAAGETAKTLTVSVTGDETSEPDETVVVSLSGSVNAAISTATGTGTITDDDMTPAMGGLSADAGDDQTVAEGVVVTLDGSRSTGPSGQPSAALSYAWAQTAGSPTVTLTGAGTVGPSFTAPQVATTTTLTFTLTVTTGGVSASDTVRVTVMDNPPRRVDSTPSFGDAAIADKRWKQNTAVTAFTLPTASGGDGALAYTLSPQLPDGISRDADHRISGTPSEPMVRTQYTWTATDADGDEATLTFSITVIEDLIPEFTETVADQLYWVGAAIDALALPAASGGNGALSHALSPALPDGLAFDADTRMVTGTPVEVMAETAYALTATDADGDVAMLSFRVEVAMPVTMSMEDAQAEEGEAVVFMVELSPPPPRPMKVLCVMMSGTATAHDDYVHMEEHRLSIAAGQHSVRVVVVTIDDVKVEPEETFTVRLVPELAVVERVGATGTILDNDAAAARARALKMVLASFGREVAQEAVEVVGERLGDVASGSHVTLAGQRVPLGSVSVSAAVGERDGEEAPSGGFDREASHRREVDKRRSVSVREIVSDSAFALSFGVPEEAGSGARDRWTVWGRTGWSEFSDRPEGELSAQGKVFSGYVGLDARVRDDLVLGVALSHSEGDMSYERSEAGGAVDARLTSVLPYGRWTAGGGLSVWGLAGAGWGEVELVDDLGATRTGMGMELLALGWRQELGAWQEVQWALKGDGFVVEVDSEAAWMLPATRAGVQRLRLMLESGTEWSVAEHGRLRTKVEFGGRWDGGDAQRGYGSEVGGSLEYVDSRLGVGIEGRGRYVLGHESQGFRTWGASLGVRVDPGGDGEGVWIGLSPVWGAPHSGVQSLWGSGPEGGGSKASSSVRMALEAGYRSGDALDVSVTVDREKAGGTSSPVGVAFRTRLRW